VKAVFSIFIGQNVSYLHLIVFIWEKASSHRLVDPKMLSNEELLIMLRREINFVRYQKGAAIDCLATYLQ